MPDFLQYPQELGQRVLADVVSSTADSVVDGLVHAKVKSVSGSTKRRCLGQIQIDG